MNTTDNRDKLRLADLANGVRNGDLLQRMRGAQGITANGLTWREVQMFRNAVVLNGGPLDGREIDTSGPSSFDIQTGRFNEPVLTVWVGQRIYEYVGDLVGWSPDWPFTFQRWPFKFVGHVTHENLIRTERIRQANPVTLEVPTGRAFILTWPNGAVPIQGVATGVVCQGIHMGPMTGGDGDQRDK